ncbi:tetratricopeptide repeat protein [Candidatus Liberibacter sp.]|uniref:tetratricopeptide repeat protein n=1 Tax=Candidatus Liberibacter sp. TaxID=34022 RepID=UPI0015F72DC6|nr:tetratricopeptide repeat protein [Candidatus Liberibacter sp.]MBA5724109.1 tetratricopeptide repeat protein [Candidatus Liberibacter sp.]
MTSSKGCCGGYLAKKICTLGTCRRKLIALVLLITVLSVAMWFYYTHTHNKTNDIAEDTFAQAMNLFHEKKLDSASIAFKKILSQGENNPYSPISRMYIASILVQKGETQEAVKKFSEIAHDESVHPIIRHIADIHSAWMLVDSALYDDLSKRLQELSNPKNPMHYSADEALGLVALRSGNVEQAKVIFEKLSKDPNIPSGIADRVHILLKNIAIYSHKGNRIS